MAGTPQAFDDLRWLQRFAARLAAHDPEDLAQEVALAAAQTPATVGRGWLATGLRNRLRMRHRSDSARRARESAYEALREATVDETAGADRLEVLGALVEALDSLAPDDRTIVLGRFFDERTAADLGAELDMPAATVRSRLKRALSRLRGDLDERFEGERVVWAAAVVSPSTLGGPAAGLGAAALLSLKSLIVVAVAAVVAAIGLGLWLRPSPPNAPPGGSPPVAADAPQTDASGDAPGDADQAKPSLDRERRWRLRRQQITAATASADTAARAPEAPLGPDSQTATDDALGAQSQAFLDCANDLEIPLVGAVVLRSRILGAPDVGTLYDDIEVIGPTEGGPALLECVHEHMYGYMGQAPSEPFETQRTVTTLGQRPEALDDDAWAQRIFDTVVTAHLGEVEACVEPSSEPNAAPARARLQMRFEHDPAAAEVTVSGLSRQAIPEATITCIVEEAQAWMFPRPMLDERTLSSTLDL